uniref:Uncharacterized protein n=1 Tax=Lepeophtheirus salmonis TaxID=72036 RepID=A0A0K2VKL0_LEPSM
MFSGITDPAGKWEEDVTTRHNFIPLLKSVGFPEWLAIFCNGGQQSVQNIIKTDTGYNITGKQAKGDNFTTIITKRRGRQEHFHFFLEFDNITSNSKVQINETTGQETLVYYFYRNNSSTPFVKTRRTYSNGNRMKYTFVNTNNTDKAYSFLTRSTTPTKLN